MDKDFDRTIWNPLEKAKSGDFNRALAQMDRTHRDVLRLIGSRQTASDGTNRVRLFRGGAVGDSLLVSAKNPVEMKVTVKSGVVLIPGASVAAIDGIVGDRKSVV